MEGQRADPLNELEEGEEEEVRLTIPENVGNTSTLL
jgi:hypothetical protein